MREPIGIAIITCLPILLIVVTTMVFVGQMPDDVPYMWNGYNVVATYIAIMFMVSFQFFGGNVLMDYIHQDFRGDRRWRMFSMPVKSNDYVFGIISACVVYCIVQGAVVIGVSAIFLDAYWGNPLVLIAALIACAITSQLIWMLLFLIFPKKSTAEAAGQIVTWGMMIASGWLMGIIDADGSPQGFMARYGTPISLARNAIFNSGFMGEGMSSALFSLGILYGFLLALAAVVFAIGKHKGFSPAKNTIAASSASTPIKGLKTVKKIQDTAPLSKQADLIITAPSDRGGGRFTIFKYALLRASRNPLSIILNAVLPLALMFFGGLWYGEVAVGFSLIGVAIMYGSFVAARGILNDKLDGTLIRILSSRVSQFQYLVQNLLAAMTPLTAQILVVGTLGLALRGWELSFTLYLMLLYFLFAASSVAFSFAWSCLFKEKETSYAMFSVLMSIVAMLGGFFMPLQILPPALRYIGALFPAYWVSNGILYLRGATGYYMGSFLVSAIAVFLFAVLYMLFGGKRRMI